MAKRRRYIDPEVQYSIEKMAISTNWTPSQIMTWLKSQPQLAGRLRSLRTIQTIVKEVRGFDKTAPWSIAEADEDEAAAILPVLAGVAEATCGNRTFLTKGEVEWINRILPCVTKLTPWDVYLVARVYMLRESRSEAAQDIDLYLAYHPWTSAEDYKRYTDAVAAEIIPPVGRDVGLRLHFPQAKKGGTHERPHPQTGQQVGGRGGRGPG